MDELLRPRRRDAEEVMSDVQALHADDAEIAELEKLRPPPEQRATPVTDLPSVAKKYAKHCVRHEANVAVGWANTRGGYRKASSLALRGLTAGGRRFVILWVETAKGGWGFELAYAHGVGRVNATQLTAYLTLPAAEIPWIDGFTPLEV